MLAVSSVQQRLKHHALSGEIWILLLQLVAVLLLDFASIQELVAKEERRKKKESGQRRKRESNKTSLNFFS